MVGHLPEPVFRCHVQCTQCTPSKNTVYQWSTDMVLTRPQKRWSYRKANSTWVLVHQSLYSTKLVISGWKCQYLVDEGSTVDCLMFSETMALGSSKTGLTDTVTKQQIRALKYIFFTIAIDVQNQPLPLMIKINHWWWQSSFFLEDEPFSPTNHY